MLYTLQSTSLKSSSIFKSYCTFGRQSTSLVSESKPFPERKEFANGSIPFSGP